MLLIASRTVKVDTKELKVVVDEELKNCPPEDLADYMPAATPRYLAYSYK